MATPMKATIHGRVDFREGDGPTIDIPRGPCEIHTTPLDVTISWTRGDVRGSAAIPMADFKRYVAAHAIVVHGAAEDEAAESSERSDQA